MPYDHAKEQWAWELEVIRRAVEQQLVYADNSRLYLSVHVVRDHAGDPTRYQLSTGDIIEALLHPEAEIIEGYAKGEHPNLETGQPNPDEMRLINTFTKDGQPVHILIAFKPRGRFKVVTHYDPRTHAWKWSDDFRSRVTSESVKGVTRKREL